MWNWLGSNAAAVGVVVTLSSIAVGSAVYFLRRSSALRRDAMRLVPQLEAQAEAIRALEGTYCLDDEEAFWGAESLAIIHEHFRRDCGRSAASIPIDGIRDASKSNDLRRDVVELLIEICAAHSRFELVGNHVAGLGSGERHEATDLLGQQRSLLIRLRNLNQRALAVARSIADSRTRRYLDFGAP